MQSRSANPHIESASNLRNGELKKLPKELSAATLRSKWKCGPGENVLAYILLRCLLQQISLRG